MARKKQSVAEDEKAGRSRFVDQPGQWVDITPPEVKKRQAEGFKRLAQMLKEDPPEKRKKSNGRH